MQSSELSSKPRYEEVNHKLQRNWDKKEYKRMTWMLKIMSKKLKVQHKLRLLGKEKNLEASQIIFLVTEQKNKKEELDLLLKIINITDRWEGGGRMASFLYCFHLSVKKNNFQNMEIIGKCNQRQLNFKICRNNRRVHIALKWSRSSHPDKSHPRALQELMDSLLNYY